MDVRDYSKRLSQHRENFQHTIDEQRKNHNREVGELKDTQEYRLNKQRQAYDNSLGKIEERQDQFRETASADTKRRIEEQQKDYLSKIDGNKREFERDRKDIKDQFDTRFKNIREAYETKGMADRSNMDHRLSSQQRRFDSTMGKMNDHFNETIDKVYRDSRDKAHSHELETKQDRRELISNYEDEMRDQLKESGEKRARLYEKFTDDVDGLRKTHKGREESLKDYQEQRISDMTAQKDKQLSENQKSFKNSIEEINDRNSRKRQVEQRDFSQNAKDLENRHAKELYRARREMNQKLAGGSREDVFNDKLDQTQRGYETRIKNIRDQIDTDRFNADIQERRRAQSTKEALRSQKQKSSEYIAELEKDMAKFKSNTLSDINIELNKDVEELQGNFKRQIKDKELEAYNDKEQSKKILERQRAQFGETVQKMSDRNTEAVSQMQADFADESKKFIQDTHMKHSQEMQEAKEHFIESKDKLAKSLTQKIEQLEETNEKLISSYESKLSRLKKANAKEIERIRMTQSLESNQLKEETRNAIALKDRENHSNVSNLRGEFDKRLSQVKQRADIQVKRMVEYYEDMIARERDESQRKYVSKVTELENQYNTLYENSKLERSNLINQYENRMEEIRAANAEALEERSSEIRSGMFSDQQESRKA
ncbi:hypothetical protein ABMA79_09570 [Halobacteriovorax sp. HFRX-2_2]|uniref:hypothetical protein n=1 Tax=unclassified Halobacteriovorax TaxID=2639665 RepID=UPI0037182F37